MNRKKLHLLVSGVFLLGIILVAFVAPVQAEEDICWEVDIVIGGSGAVFINRGFGNWHLMAEDLDFGTTYTVVVSIPPGGGATLVSPGSNYFINEPGGVGAGEWIWSGNFSVVQVGALANTPWDWWVNDPAFGSARLLPYADAGACHGANMDGRLNPFDVSVNAALYNHDGGLRVYLIDEATSVGWLAIDASAGEIAAAIAAAEETGVNQPIGEAVEGVSLWALFTCGEGDECVQMNYAHYNGTRLELIVVR